MAPGELCSSQCSVLSLLSMKLEPLPLLLRIATAPFAAPSSFSKTVSHWHFTKPRYTRATAPGLLHQGYLLQLQAGLWRPCSNACGWVHVSVLCHWASRFRLCFKSVLSCNFTFADVSTQPLWARWHNQTNKAETKSQCSAADNTCIPQTISAHNG